MKYRIKDIINPLKWWSVVVGFFKLKIQRMEPHVITQYALRFNTPECQPCFEKGKCFQSPSPGIDPCNCAMPDKALVAHESCSCGYWGPIIKDKQEWEEYKKIYKLKFEPKYGNDK